MHLGHDHDHHHHHGGAGAGHNSRRDTVQWQNLHGHAHEAPVGDGPADIDLVEAAFIAGFPQADDPTSFLRLAGIAFSGEARDGATLALLRVEIGQTTDIGTLTPHVGGAGHRYDPLPARLASKRRTLAFAYFDGVTVRRLTFAEARALEDRTPGR